MTSRTIGGPPPAPAPVHGNGARLGVVDERHPGTPLAVWDGWTRRFPILDTSTWQRVVAVAPHPDDEVLGVGALLSRLVRDGYPVHVVAVTDGDGADPTADATARAALATRRVRESRCAAAVLGLPVPERLRVPDGRVAEHEDVLVEQLAARLGPGAVCLATWDGDGHPDHEAVGRAAGVAARRTGARVVHYPVWAWHWSAPDDPAVPWDRAARLLLDRDEHEAKRAAVRCFVSQVTASDGRSPVLPAPVVDRLTTQQELVLLLDDLTPHDRVVGPADPRRRGR